MMGLPFVFGEIERTRNRALVEAGMGLGEYTYIYVVGVPRSDAGADRAEANLFSVLGGERAGCGPIFAG